MQKENNTPALPLYMVWWNGLDFLTIEELTTKYWLTPIEGIYKAEHPSTTEQSKEVDNSVEGFTGGEWYTSGQTVFVNINGDKKYRGQVCTAFSPETIYSVREFKDDNPNEEAEANAALISEAKNMYYFIKKLVSGERYTLDEAKEILNRIQSQSKTK